MAIPKRGSRNIVVNGEPYRWYVRRKPSYGQDFLDGFCNFSVAIEYATAKGSVLVVSLPQRHPLSHRCSEIVAVVPADVEEYIKTALARGWQPKQPGKTFVLDMTADE